MGFGLEGLRGTAGAVRGLRELLQQRYEKAQTERKWQMEERRQTEAERATRVAEQSVTEDLKLRQQEAQQRAQAGESLRAINMAKLQLMDKPVAEPDAKLLQGQGFGAYLKRAQPNFPP